MTEADSATGQQELADEIAEQVGDYLTVLRAVASENNPGLAIPVLLVELSRLLLAGAKLGVQLDFVPRDAFEPDAGPDADLDGLRQELAAVLADVDMFAEVFDPYATDPQLYPVRLSDDLSDIASSLVHGLQHYRSGNVEEALWWWQFSYVSSWGGEASGALRALQSIVAHDRLDISDVEAEAARVRVADAR